MLKHPSRKDLDRFLLSALPPARRRLITRHLMGCEACFAYISPSLEVMLAPEKVDTEKPSETGDLYDAALDRACRKALDRTGIVRERKRAAPVIADLVQGRRKFRDLSEEEHDAIQGIPKVDLLLEEAKALRHEEPGKMIEAADLAKKAAMRLDPRIYGPHIVADTRARALAELANAYRTADRLSSSEAAMAQAIYYLERGSGDLHLAARIAELAASLACDQRHFHEAHELIDRAFLIHLQLGDGHMAGRALITKSHYLSCAGNAKEALIFVTEGFTLLDLKRDPSLGAAALQNAIHYAVDAGHLKKAQHHLWNAQNHGLLPNEEINRIKLRATAGEIFAGLGQLDRAEMAFRTAKADFEDLGLIYVAGITGIDLAAVWMRQGRVEEVKELAEKLQRGSEILRTTPKHFGMAPRFSERLQKLRSGSAARDAACQHGRAVAVVDVDHSDPRSAGVQHGEKGGEAAEARSVTDARRHRDHRGGDQAGNDGRQGAVHPGDRHYHVGLADGGQVPKETVQARDPHVEAALDLVPEPGGADRGLLGHWQVRGAGGQDGDGPRAGLMRLTAGQDAGALVVGRLGPAGEDRLRRIRPQAGDEHPAVGLHHPVDDGLEVFRRLAFGIDRFGKPVAQLAVEVQLGEAEVGIGKLGQLGEGLVGREVAGGDRVEELPELLRVHDRASAPPRR